MIHYVYGLVRKNSTNKDIFYIGITDGKNISFRERNHRTEKFNKHKLNIIKRYDFDLVILWSCVTRYEAEQREEFLIRWYGKQLCNICASAWDTSRATSKPKKPKGQWKKHSQEVRIANRDRNLTLPYEKIIQLIEEWAANPLETQQSFADRNNISRSKFKDWIRLYAPQYVGLTKKKQKEIFTEAYDKDDSPKDTINKLMNNTGWSYNKSKGLYYRMINNEL